MKIEIERLLEEDENMNEFLENPVIDSLLYLLSIDLGNTKNKNETFDNVFFTELEEISGK